jgi:hypothetical protein
MDVTVLAAVAAATADALPPVVSSDDEWWETVDHATSMGVEAVTAQRSRIAPWFGVEQVLYRDGSAALGLAWDREHLVSVVVGTSSGEVLHAMADDIADHLGD